MKTMTIYALMGKIYNNNQDMPKKIKYGNKIYEWKEYDCGYQEKKKINWVKKWGYVAEVDRTYYYLEHCFKDLHDEVEIIEENNKIEKYKHIYEKTAIEDYKMARFNSNDMEKICNRIGWLMENNNDLGKIVNQIIDKVNEMNNED